jgi:hypothetical protein
VRIQPVFPCSHSIVFRHRRSFVVKVNSMDCVSKSSVYIGIDMEMAVYCHDASPNAPESELVSVLQPIKHRAPQLHHHF